MKFTIEMVAARLPDLLAASRRERLPLAPARIALAPLSDAHRPDYDDSRWDTLYVGDRWGGAGLTYWLRIPLRIPDTWADQPAVVHIALGDYENITGPEALAYLDGEPIQAFDYYHKDLLISDHLRPGQDHMLALEAYSSLMQGQQTLRALELIRIDAEAEALYHDMRVLHGALLTMPPNSLNRARLVRTLERAYQALDLRQPQSGAYLQSVPHARAILREAYEHGDASDQPRTVAVGHAHIDLAWLWPVAQTRRKGARTFSTVLKLMEQYPHYHFVASQPALYQIIQQDEPRLYARIKERIAEGRWEPTGAAWVEMDCNLAGGEALVRQFLYGQRFFRDQLGVETRLLWLPDVFGYSAALPQVLKGCGVDYFMTTKISWNEYNRLPHDTFRWRGIDGTEVLTHMVTAPLNPSEQSGSTMPQAFYTYNAKFTPYDVAGNWSTYRQKDINDELLYLFGYGDGGGGPTAQMQETAARLEHLPGFPRVEQSSAEQFFRRLERRVWNDPNLPTWAGELYLEYHRGTYTSQAWIKRANRLNELLYREAELWSALAATTAAPQATIASWQADLAQGWQTLLFNQFHDILPGSSINQVYVDARADHREVAARGERVRDAALDAMSAALTGQHTSATPTLLVFNPAPFDRADPVELTLPAGATLPPLTDTTGQPILTQDLERDDAGQTRLLVGASAPALGYRAYTSGVTETSGASPASRAIDVAPDTSLTITCNLLENRFFRLMLDERGHITSLYDKRANREVIAPGSLGNQFFAFEDRPLNFDAWDINIYYQDKPYPVDDLTSLRVVESGPLRGGVEIVRRYCAST
ncbi:MAG: alpha-mannosidase, partial [Ktedonobacterales bacterium]